MCATPPPRQSRRDRPVFTLHGGHRRVLRAANRKPQVGRKARLISVDIFNQRDVVLRAIHELGTDFQHTSNLRKVLPDIDPQELQQVFGWLERNNLLDLVGQMPGDVGTFRITTLGEHLVETGTSTRVVAEQAVKGAMMNQQTNYNFGMAQNLQGDHNTITLQQSLNAHLEEIKKILRDHGHEVEAQELETIEKTEGPKNAVKKIAAWIDTKFLNPEVLSAITPLAGQAAIDLL